MLIGCPNDSPSKDPIIKLDKVTKVDSLVIDGNGRDTIIRNERFEIQKNIVFQNFNRLTLDKVEFIQVGDPKISKTEKNFLVRILAKPLKDSLDLESKGTLLNMSNIRILNVQNSALNIRGRYLSTYHKLDSLTYFERINLDGVYVGGFRYFGVAIQSVKTKVRIRNVNVRQNEKVLYWDNGAKALSVTTDIFAEANIWGMEINAIVKAVSAKVVFFYLQNPKQYTLELYSDNALFDGVIPSYGSNLVKIKQFYDPNNKAKNYIKARYTNTNSSLNMKTITGKDAGKYRNGLRLEGMGNVFLDLDLDIPFSVTSSGFIGKEFYKNKTPFGTVTANKIISRIGYSRHATIISDIVCDSLISINKSVIHERNSDIKYRSGTIKIITKR